MDDFASQALFALVTTELQRQGVRVPSKTRFEGKVDRRQKAQLLSHGLEKLGVSGIIRIGFGIERIPTEPILDVLSHSTDTFDMIARWQRMERYFHGRHRVRIQRSDALSVSLSHYAVSGNGPSKGEDLLIAGLLAALMKRIGIIGVDLSIADLPVISDGDIVSIDNIPTCTASWDFSWQRSEEGPALQVSSDNNRISDRLKFLIESDLGRGWKLADAAAELALSKRSLQRHLSESGHSFQTLLRIARADGAAKKIREDQLSLGSIGYQCGYSDQSHFQREFKSRLNMTPAEYAAFSSCQ